jgi:suppressor of tumorigenicity protein 13
MDNSISNKLYNLTTINELNVYSQNISTKLLVLYFKATWCGPCKAIKPFISYLQDNYPNVEFCEIDIEDDSRDTIVKNFNIIKVPTFIFYKNAKLCKSIIGTNKENIEETINEFL